MSVWKYIIAGIVVALITGFAIYQLGIDGSPSTKEQFTKYKIEKREGLTSKKPTEWFTISRAYPYRDIPKAEYKAALHIARAVHHASVGLVDFPCSQVGPYNVGGRITAIAAHPDSPDLIYAGAALGGVLKSDDRGQSWEFISDDVPSLSVGDLAVDPDDPDVLYLGTGEANSSGDSYAGTGLYRTTNGGDDWEFLGFANSCHIGRVAIDPSDNTKLFVASMGSLFSTSNDRGVYRSTNGGTNWEQVLFTNDSTGCIDIVINPSNTDIVYASMWQRIRGPEDRRVGGTHSGIYRSIDGGDNWDRLTTGLPSGEDIGRIGLAICPSNPSRLYASVVNHPGDLIDFYRTDNGGDNWSDMLVNPNVGSFSSFGWYFGQIWAHPVDQDIVCFGDVSLWRSYNGGSYWYDISGITHVDHHALYIDPTNPEYMINGNDGGVFITENGGNSWTKCYDLPITQFYAITIDKNTPYRIYGGTQDNSTPGTITGGVDDWETLFYGDGFYVNVDFTNSNTIYAEAQYGYLGKSTDLGNNWDLIFNSNIHGERSNWCTPVVMSHFDNDILFYGAQRVYKTTNAGLSFNAISPDLTGGPGDGSLLFGTITTISQSPLNPDIIWAGTDDSRVWVTEDGGGSWEMVSDDLPDRWCSRVSADVYDETVCYVTFTGYKVDDLMPHIFKTETLGATWSDISGNLEGVPVNDILPDPQRRGWLYIGTDFGMFYSDNNGTTWQGMSPDHPICPVFDIDICSNPFKLISGTHGRSMYEFDLGAVGIDDPDRSRPVSYKLNQNYPNPFNAATTISYELLKPGHVNLSVYDITGRLAATLVDREVSAGEHKLTYDASPLASGTYFLSMRTADGQSSRKMTLVK